MRRMEARGWVLVESPDFGVLGWFLGKKRGGWVWGEQTGWRLGYGVYGG